MEHQPNARFNHVFAIIRWDLPTAAVGELDTCRVTITKVLYSEQAAREEVDRLNRINAGKRCHYTYEITRLERRTENENPRTAPPA